jgi:two-component system, chemotaxis family, chemotaxis protein CheY
MSAKILVVEDTEDARELLVCALELEGFTVISAEDGYSAIELAQSETPALIITDINMPKMDGIQMIKKMRNLPVLEKVPILVISAYQSGIVKEALAAGANASMKKPLEFDALIKLIFSLVASMLFVSFNSLISILAG